MSDYGHATDHTLTRGHTRSVGFVGLQYLVSKPDRLVTLAEF